MLPPMVKIRQAFETDFLEDPARDTEDQLSRARLSEVIKAGDRVGITVGSRGIRDLQKILEAVVKSVSDLKAHPVFLPAMGSHGGGTVENQAQIVRDATGDALAFVPVNAAMEVTTIGETSSGFPVYFSSAALEMDKIVVVNRIKPHTDFTGKIESGLLKITAIGLGKHKGAETYHIVAKDLGLERVIREVAATILSNAPIALGIGLVENAYGRVAKISAVNPDNFAESDEAMLLEAMRLMPRLPFDSMDILVVDEIGKDISGNGMDTTIVGRYGEKSANDPNIDWIFVRDLTEKSQGNAIGIGLADVTTARLVQQIDREATAINCVTSLSPELGKVPLYFDDDAEAFQTLVRMTGVDSGELQVVWIRNTSDLEQCLVSTAYLEDIKRRDDLELLESPVPVNFDQEY